MFGFIKQGIQQMMIARPEAAHRLVIYKWPDRTIPMYTRLTVKSDEGAVFFKNGVCMGILGPGVHTLDGANIPFLKNLIDGATGGNALLGEVFFVRSQPNRNDPVKFGTKFDGMTDPGTDVTCNPGVHGEFVVRVIDPVAFIVGLVGQSIQPEDNTAIFSWVKKRFEARIEPVIANFLRAKGESLLNMSSLKTDLEQAMMQEPPAALTELGLQLVELTTFKVSLSEDDRASLTEVWRAREGGAEDKLKMKELRHKQMEIGVNVAERQAFVNLAQNPGYMQYAQSEALLSAGEGMAKGGGNAGIAALGAQMAVGVGMAGMFQPAFQPAMQHQRVAPSAAAAVCGGCSFNNAGGGKFCAGCGQPLAPPRPAGVFCTGCGGQNAAGAKFCASCGAAQAAAAPAAAPA
ncbi:MAG: SPFH domain-containing protein [Myxococcales bacterium]|nr:SPFH domain-containing protein [Myxococcales bacterium]